MKINTHEGSDASVEYTFDNTGAEEEGMARLFINIGKAQKVKAKDILGAIAGEANIPGKLVGAIDLYDKYITLPILSITFSILIWFTSLRDGTGIA